MALDAAVVDALSARAAAGVARSTDRAEELSLRQSDGAAYDMRTLGGVLANSLIGMDERANVAGLNTAIRTPNTVEHYPMSAGFAAPGAPAGSAAAPAGK